MLRWAPRLGFVVWTGLIFFLSLHPAPPSLPSALLSWDKFQHAAAFGLLAILGAFSFPPSYRSPRAWLAGFLAALLIGALVEAAQGVLTVNRTAEWGDLIADAVGAGSASLAGCFRLFRKRPGGNLKL